MVKQSSPQPEYSFTYSKSNPKKGLKKAVVALLTAAFVSLTVSGATIVSETSTAYAMDVACPVYAGDNNEYEKYAKLGGMTTAQIEHIQTLGLDKTAAMDDVPELTFPEQFGENMVFTNWVPYIGEDVTPYGSINSNNGESWRSFTGGGETSNLPETSTPEPDFIDFLNDRLNCKVDIGFASAGTVMPNILLDIGKFIYDITDNIYVAAMGGSTNITNVVALDTEAGDVENFDEIFITDESNNESWSIQVANVIEEALVGQDGEGGLYNTLYLNFLIPLIFVAAIVIIVNLLRTKAVRALTGFVWIIVVIALGVAVLQTPMAAPKFIDGLVGTVGNTAAEAITETASPSEENSTTCSIEDPNATIPDIQARTVSCRIWENTVFKAWERGQFGDSSFDDVESKEFIQYMYAPRAANAAYTVAGSGGKYDAFFTSSGQEYNAIIGIIAVSSVGFFVLGNSILLMGYQISMLLLIFTAPIFFIAGIVPSTMGRGVFLRWLELIVGILVKKLVVTILLAIFLAMFFIIASIEFPSLLIQSVVFVVITYIGFTQRSKIIEMFTGKINFGGDKSINVGSSIESVADKSAVVAMGATAVGTGLALKATGKGIGKGAAFAGRKGVTGVRRTVGTNKIRKMQKGVAEGKHTQSQVDEEVLNKQEKLGTKWGSKFVDENGKLDPAAHNAERENARNDRKSRKAERASGAATKAEAKDAEATLKRPYGMNSEEDVKNAQEKINARDKVLADKKAKKIESQIASRVAKQKTSEKRAAALAAQMAKIPEERKVHIQESEITHQITDEMKNKQKKQAQKQYRKNPVTQRHAEERASSKAKHQLY